MFYVRKHAINVLTIDHHQLFPTKKVLSSLDSSDKRENRGPLSGSNVFSVQPIMRSLTIRYLVSAVCCVVTFAWRNILKGLSFQVILHLNDLWRLFTETEQPIYSLFTVIRSPGQTRKSTNTYMYLTYWSMVTLIFTNGTIYI